MTGFSVEDMVIDCYYWFDKSTKIRAQKERPALLSIVPFVSLAIGYSEAFKHPMTQSGKSSQSCFPAVCFTEKLLSF